MIKPQHFVVLAGVTVAALVVGRLSPIVVGPEGGGRRRWPRNAP